MNLGDVVLSAKTSGVTDGLMFCINRNNISARWWWRGREGPVTGGDLRKMVVVDRHN